MRPIIAVFSYPRLTEFIHQLKIKLPAQIKLEIFDLVLEDALAQALRMEREGTADVFVSSGGNAKLLTQYLKSPFVEIKVTGFDLLLALRSALKYDRCVAVVTCLRHLPHIDEIMNVLAMDIKQVTYNEAKEVDPILEKLKGENINNIVGGSLIVDRAEAQGMHGHLIYSREGVIQALETAAQLALAERAHAEKTKAMQAILDFAYDGILAVDEEGNITTFNAAAEKITGVLQHEALGQPVARVIGKSRQPSVLSVREPELDQVQTFGKCPVLTNWVPIKVKGNITGAVATFQPISTVQASEKKIRLNLHKKGLVARNTLEDILGESPALITAKKKAELFAQSESNVLIYGRTGTGKELFAQGIHNASRRAQGPFVAINCAALPENLLESELFGYEEGAFTGARKGGKQGLFELAHGGTIFLDEISEISAGVQARLLRVLEEREVMRLGGESVIPVDVRVVAATNRDLNTLVQQGQFREDLFFRLYVLELRLPTLAERVEDIPLLMERFLLENKVMLELAEIKQIAHHHLLTTYSWPGNVRELKNFAERIVTLCSMQPDPDQLLHTIFENRRGIKKNHSEKQDILRVLKEVGGNRTLAAAKLGISRTTLWRRLKEIK